MSDHDSCIRCGEKVHPGKLCAASGLETTCEAPKSCNNGDLACGQGYWDCGKCSDARSRAAYARLTPAQKAYDNYVDPLGAYHTDYDRADAYSREPDSCSCHISPPCSFCVEKDWDVRSFVSQTRRGRGLMGDQDVG